MKKMRIYILLLCVCCVAYSRAGESYTNAVKVTFLSWITGSTKVSYERAFAKHQTSEICGSVIGAGYDKFRNRPQGFTVRYGHKFFLLGNHEGGLQGLYLRPEVIILIIPMTLKSLSCVHLLEWERYLLLLAVR